MKSSGIYVIWNSVNGHRYIGSAINMHKRWLVHRKQLSRGIHHSRYLQRSWDKYGDSSFSFLVIACCGRSELLNYEQRAIDLFRPEYNVCLVAGSSLGVKKTAETLQKMSAASSASLRGKKRAPFSAEHRQNLSIAAKRRVRSPMSQETRARIAATKIGKPLSMQHRRKLSESHKGQSRKLTEEHKSKISQGHQRRRGALMPSLGLS